MRVVVTIVYTTTFVLRCYENSITAITQRAQTTTSLGTPCHTRCSYPLATRNDLHRSPQIRNGFMQIVVQLDFGSWLYVVYQRGVITCNIFSFH